MTKQHDSTEKAKAQLDKWDAQIAETEARLKGAEADARVEIQNRLEEMREAREDARAQLAKLQGAGGAAWGDVQKGLEDAWTRLETSFDQASKRFA